MQFKRITMQDIADACGLSRNTVSKVFNGRGSVPPDTRSRVLQKARVLGYGTPPEHPGAVPDAEGNIALLTEKLPGETHFGSYFLSAFSDQISRCGYSLRIYEISPEERQEMRLPPHFSADKAERQIGHPRHGGKEIGIL